MSKPKLISRSTQDIFTFDHPVHGRIQLIDYVDLSGDCESEVLDSNGFEIVDPDLIAELAAIADSL